MECIKCKTSAANKESGYCTACEQDELRKINGLLYLPALGLLISVVYGGVELWNFISAVFDYFDITGFISYYAMGAVAFLLSGMVVSLYAAWLFFRRKKGTRRIMVIYYIVGLAAALYFTVLPAALFDVKLDTDNAGALVSAVVGVVIWIPYFLLSKRVNEVFCH